MLGLEERLAKMEEEVRVLELTSETREELSKQFLQYSEDFLESLPHRKGYQIHNEESLHNFSLREEPIPIDEIVRYIDEQIDTQGINATSGRHLGYIPGGGLFASAWGDYLAAITNRYSGMYFAAPGAVKMENKLIEWTASMLDFPKDCGGNITTGSSLGTLTAFHTARESRNIKARDYEKVVVYLSEYAHHSQNKALKLIGLGECITRYVPVDDNFKMVPLELEKVLADDKENGLMPWLLIASAGTTDTGTVDPLDELGLLAKQYGLWYHVDAAYGGYFALVDQGKSRLKGIEKADSVVIDPHKGFLLPFGIGIVLVRDKKQMLEAHDAYANYMQDAKGIGDISPAEVSPELSKHFRGMRMALPIMLHGLKPFRKNIEEKLLLTHYLYEKMQAIPGIELGPFPDLTIFIFRCIPQKGDANEFNQKLLNEIHKDGRIFLSSTTIEDDFMIRMAILSYRTHKAILDMALAIIQEKISFLQMEE